MSGQCGEHLAAWSLHAKETKLTYSLFGMGGLYVGDLSDASKVQLTDYGWIGCCSLVILMPSL